MTNLLGGMINLATSPMSTRQRNKTISRLAQRLQSQDIKDIETNNGKLKFFAFRGAGVVSAVERFHEDEPETLEWLDTYVKGGEILWDIGANIGLYSLYAAKRPYVKVLAFEPSGLNFSLLVEHIALNKLSDQISPLCVALSNETKIEKLHMGILEAGHASNALGTAETQFESFNPIFSQAVPSITADNFCKIFGEDTPDHIKLDVDGIEPLILEGMEKTLPKVKTIVVEVEGDNEAEAAKVEAPLKKAGFEEDPSHREKGKGRNRLYLHKKNLKK